MIPSSLDLDLALRVVERRRIAPLSASAESDLLLMLASILTALKRRQKLSKDKQTGMIVSFVPASRQVGRWFAL